MAAGLQERIKSLFGERARALYTEQWRRLREAADPRYQAARAWYNKRESREKLLLKAAAALVGVFLIYNLVCVPIQSLRDDLQARVASRQSDLVQVRALMRTYGQLNVDIARAGKRTIPTGRDFSLFSVVEQSLTTSVGRNKIGSITPSDHKISGQFTQYAVDLKLSGLSLQQLVDALYGVQHLPVPVAVANLSIKQRPDNPRSYDVDMQCVALGTNG